jgi:hypothetical protein
MTKLLKPFRNSRSSSKLRGRNAVSGASVRPFRLGPSKRVRIRVRIAVGFRARFAAKGLRVFILYHTPIKTVCKQISDEIDPKFDCYPPLAPNCTLNPYAHSYANMYV